ncbi:hypothetical protein A3C99_03070 [Candidatus Daviesbacteria bacterium RIFCSPHIGHO2_02_FULL_37_9]|nr:MAG: hypothetical protein A3C99_03070 [Candidatus Daviesbacteria bacterium RIFCSPHIGHO2_02_FULL_37_9]
MADLLASQESKPLSISRGQEVDGEIVSISDNEIILDLGTKSEGVLPKRDLSPEQAANLKVGDKLLTFVIQTENESGQVVLGLQRSLKTKTPSQWYKFEAALKSNSVLKGKALELNRGGLIVEVEGIRGFLPSSQVTLSQAANLEELVGKDVDVTPIEVEANQNRLIFSQKTTVSEDIKENLSKLKAGDEIKGVVAAVLPFGIFVTLQSGVEGLVHVSEISWEKTEDPSLVYKVGDEVKAKVLSVETNTGRANLSIRQLVSDPFKDKAKDLQADDIVKGTVTKVSTQGISVSLEGGIEGMIHSSKIDNPADFEVGKNYQFLVDSVDNTKRRVNLASFVTSTAGLIYK